MNKLYIIILGLIFYKLLKSNKTILENFKFPNISEMQATAKAAADKAAADKAAADKAAAEAVDVIANAKEAADAKADAIKAAADASAYAKAAANAKDVANKAAANVKASINMIASAKAVSDAKTAADDAKTAAKNADNAYIKANNAHKKAIDALNNAQKNANEYLYFIRKYYKYDHAIPPAAKDRITNAAILADKAKADMEDASKALSDAASASGDATRAANAANDAANKAIADKAAIDKENLEKEKLKTIEEYATQNIDFNNRIIQLEDKVKENTKQNGTLENKVNENAKKIIDFNNRIIQLENKVNENTKQNNVFNNRIIQLENKVNENTKQNNVFNNRFTKLEMNTSPIKYDNDILIINSKLQVDYDTTINGKLQLTNVDISEKLKLNNWELSGIDNKLNFNYNGKTPMEFSAEANTEKQGIFIYKKLVENI